MATERTTPPQAGSSGEGLKVGDRVRIVGPSVSGLRARIGKEGMIVQLLPQRDEYVLNPVGQCTGLIYSVSSLTRIPPAQAEPVEAKEPWKLVVGEKVLVEAVVRTVWEDEYEGDTTIRVKWKDDTESWGIVSASQLRPLPVVQGGNLGNS